jgi:hypothetical protein
MPAQRAIPRTRPQFIAVGVVQGAYITGCRKVHPSGRRLRSPAIRIVVSAATPGAPTNLDVIAGRAYVQVGGDHALGRVAGQERL